MMDTFICGVVNSLRKLFKKRSLLFSFLFLPIAMFGQNVNIPPTTEGPVEVTIGVRINKIYNINSVDETYQTDGYLELSWHDQRMDSTSLNPTAITRVFENNRAQQLIDTNLWFPACELINIQGEQDTPNKQITIHPDGEIVYTERFFGTFHSQMNYKKFPFDTQKFVLFVEPFSYNNEQVVFVNPSLFPKDTEKEHIGDDWEVLGTNTAIKLIDYEDLEIIGHTTDTYTRAIFEVQAKRLSGYYIWQVLFPLLIIILASFVIFWIKDFGTQIGIGFTLMLTVVAFNFYSASILPKLPYNTFIEYVIIVGYIFIFFGIISVVINHQINPDMKAKSKNKLMNWFKIIFPLTYFLIMIILYYSFLA